MSDTDRRAEPGAAAVPGAPGADEGMPRWVKVSLIVAAVVVALFLIAKATGIGGEHGPGRHGGGGSPTTVVDGGHRSPVDHGP